MLSQGLLEASVHSKRRILDSIPDPYELTDMDLLHPTQMTHFAASFCYQFHPIPVFSPLPNLLLLFTGFSLQFQTFFFGLLVPSTFQVTQQQPLFPKSTPYLQFPSQSFSVLLSSMEMHMERPCLFILKISQKAVLLSSLGKTFPSYRKVRIRKSSVSILKEMENCSSLAPFLWTPKFQPCWSVRFITHSNDSFVPQTIKITWRRDLNHQWLISHHSF